MENNLLSLIIFAPLAGATINWFVGRRLRNERFIGIVACGAVAVSTIVAFLLAFNSHGALRAEAPIMDHLWTWIQVGAFRADFGLAMDRLSGSPARSKPRPGSAALGIDVPQLVYRSSWSTARRSVIVSG